MISQIAVSSAADLKVAVASNFTPTLKTLAQAFERQTGHQILISAGSTGKLYAQILHGAPYDLFMAADAQRPQKLLQAGKAANNDTHTYAIGQLALWGGSSGSLRKSMQSNQPQLLTRLKNLDFYYLAMANPKVAPYGLAALQVLDALELSEILRNKVVRGENIGQTFHFVETGNAQLGFVALSQLMLTEQHVDTYWRVPEDLYTPIEQQLVLLRNTPHGLQFVAFLKSTEAKAIIQTAGYKVGD